jgi:hypothetical protein
MMRSLVRLLVVAALLVAAFLLNPTPEQHRAKIRSVVSERSLVAKGVRRRCADGVRLQLHVARCRVVHHGQRTHRVDWRVRPRLRARTRAGGLTPPAHAARTGYFFGSTPTAIASV